VQAGMPMTANGDIPAPPLEKMAEFSHQLFLLLAITRSGIPYSIQDSYLVILYRITIWIANYVKLIFNKPEMGSVSV
jgi:hypothetical protein